jgi:hypothetical protein
MTDQEKTLLIQDIVDKALENDAQQFQHILYWSDFRYYRKYAIANKLIIKTLKRAANNLFKEYCRDVIAGISDITKLVAYQQLLDITDFYIDELKTLQAMLDDYDEYLGDWSNFFKAIFGGRRDI